MAEIPTLRLHKRITNETQLEKMEKIENQEEEEEEEKEEQKEEQKESRRKQRRILGVGILIDDSARPVGSFVLDGIHPDSLPLLISFFTSADR